MAGWHTGCQRSRAPRRVPDCKILKSFVLPCKLISVMSQVCRGSVFFLSCQCLNWMVGPGWLQDFLQFKSLRILSSLAPSRPLCFHDKNKTGQGMRREAASARSNLQKRRSKPVNGRELETLSYTAHPEITLATSVGKYKTSPHQPFVRRMRYTALDIGVALPATLRRSRNAHTMRHKNRVRLETAGTYMK